jgi:four helix bundle protein
MGFSDSVTLQKSFRFAVRIVRLRQHLQREHKEFDLSRQVLRSGTAVGALVREARFAQSRADFVHKLSIALKEANETDYWIDLLAETGYLESRAHQSIKEDIQELIRLLAASVKTGKTE